MKKITRVFILMLSLVLIFVFTTSAIAEGVGDSNVAAEETGMSKDDLLAWVESAREDMPPGFDMEVIFCETKGEYIVHSFSTIDVYHMLHLLEVAMAYLRESLCYPTTEPLPGLITQFVWRREFAGFIFQNPCARPPSSIRSSVTHRGRLFSGTLSFVSIESSYECEYTWMWIAEYEGWLPLIIQ